jgi:hypothetical protein
MFSVTKPYRQWSDIGLQILIGSVAAAIALAIADGVMKGPVAMADYSARPGMLTMFSVWIVDLRFIAEQTIIAAALFFVGAKFFETRTIFAVGFDRADTSRVTVKGPDDDNTVWIGYRYGNHVEAASVAAAFQERLAQSAVA